MTAVRRSGRERKQATSVYAEAAAEKEAAEEEAAAAASAAKAKARRASASGSSAKKAAKAKNAKGGRGKKKTAATTKKKNKKQEDEDEDMSDASEDEEEAAGSDAEEEEEAPPVSDDDDEDMLEDESDDEEDDDNDDEDFEEEEAEPTSARKRKGQSNSKAKKPTSAAKKRTAVGGGKKIAVQVKNSNAKSKKSGGGGGRGGKSATKAKTKGGSAAGGAAGRRGINNALANLSKKVLEEEEVPGNAECNSLVASLLHAHQPNLLGPASAAQRKRMAAALSKTNAPAGIATSQPHSIYTPNLTLLAKKIVSIHNADPNMAQIHLLNLIFRSVGGTTDVLFDPTHDDLEDMNDEDWNEKVTNLVDDIRMAKPDEILICADPLGAVHSTSKDPSKITAGSLGVREFRKIYEEFWYVLGDVALTEGGMANAPAQVSSDEDDGSSDEEEEDEMDSSDDDDTTDGKTTASKKKKATKSKKKTTKKKASFPVSSTIRYDAELVNNLINRLQDINNVGQPDVRAAAVVAAYKVGQAVLDKTVHLSTRLEVAQRQLKAAKKQGGRSGGSDKVESLQHQVDSLKRTLANLDESVIENTTINGIFVHRYRDSSPHIRAASIQALSVMTLQRPEMFLRDKYLKYFGWMMSDKNVIVRLAAIGGLLAPFDAIQKASTSSDSAVLKAAERIDLTLLQHVVTKFLPRLADAVIDSDLRVQEKAMALLLSLLREGFLDECEDDNLWSQINNRAVAPDTSPAVRRDALYFVLEQLEAFDEGEEDSDEEDVVAAARRRRGKDSTSASDSSDRRIAQRLDAIASWCAVLLTDGDIPIDKIRVELSDYLVHSLRAMPENRALVTTWSAMLRAIGDDAVTVNGNGNVAGDRVDVAKQRVLVQMMAAAVKAEVGAVGDSSLFENCIDPDVLAAEAALLDEDEVAKTGGKSTTKKGSADIQHENLSIALLKVLPDLLVKFKTDPAVTASLTTLPRYLLPTVFSLPQRKGDFISLVKRLSDIFLQSSDETVLENISLSLRYLSDGDHSRAPDGSLQLKNITQELRDRLVDLFADMPSDGSQSEASSKRKRRSTGKSPSKRRRGESPSSRASTANVTDDEDDGIDESSTAVEIEYGIYLNLMRFRILFQHCNLSPYLQDDDGDTSDDDDGVEAICSVVADGLAKRLNARKPSAAKDDVTEGESTVASTSTKHTSIWDKDEKNIAMITARAVEQGLNLITAATGWKLHEVMEEENLVVDDDDDDIMEEVNDDDDDDDEIEDHVVLRLRDRAIALIELCYEQFVEDSAVGDDDESIATHYTDDQKTFATLVQIVGARVATDLRSLFPKEWGHSASPLLRAFAIVNDGRLIGGFVRCLRSKEEMLRANDGAEEEDMMGNDTLLLPIARVLAFNWKEGNRREAGVALAHLTGSGDNAHSIMSALSKVLKKNDPVRYLEAQMASLRQSFEDWIENEPEEPGDMPTDAEMTAFENAEAAHKQQFLDLEQQAWKLSQSLGVGKLNKELSPALLGFVQEGIRFAFSNTGGDDDEEDEWALGTRLSFLKILVKYANWAKKNKSQKQTLKELLDEKEIALHDHPDFNEVLEEDLEALKTFRKALGLEPTAISVDDDGASRATHGTLDTPMAGNDADGHMTPSPSTGGKYSRGGSTNRSHMSSVSGLRSLSPLYEKDGDEASPDGSGDGSDTEGGSIKESIAEEPGEEEEEQDEEAEEEGSDDDSDEEFSQPKRKSRGYGSQSQRSAKTFDPY